MAYRIPRSQPVGLLRGRVATKTAGLVRALVAPWDELSAPIGLLLALYGASLLHRLATLSWLAAVVVAVGTVVLGRVALPLAQRVGKASVPFVLLGATVVAGGASYLRPGPAPRAVALGATVPAFPGLPGFMVPEAAPPAPVPQGVPARKGALPVGKGMWLYVPERTEGGDPWKIVRRAKDVGLTHLYVRTGSSWAGFYAQDFLNRLLPIAHAAGIRVYGWDFPNLRDWNSDAFRSFAAVQYTTPDGHRIDGFAADIETGSEGVRLVPEAALAYGTALRQAVGNDYPLIAVVPKPYARRFPYPYPHVVAQFDAIAPMVYWMHRDPGEDVKAALHHLRQFGKPLMPVGQTYDGAPEGGPPGVPPPEQLERFVKVASEEGASGVSFWSWQAADQHAWDFIRDTDYFVVPAGKPKTPAEVRSVQTLVLSLGFPSPVHGRYDLATAVAVKEYQTEAGLPSTGQLDRDTRDRLLTPFTVPIRPLR